ncbi:hypothetical protein JOQ06_014479, partial [Pogonophryne albipinna]
MTSTLRRRTQTHTLARSPKPPASSSCAPPTPPLFNWPLFTSTTIPVQLGKHTRTYVHTYIHILWPLADTMTLEEELFTRAAEQNRTDTARSTHLSIPDSSGRNMRAGSNSHAGKAVVDSNLDLAGLDYFYFPESHGERGRRGTILSERSFVRSADFYRRSTTDKRVLQSYVTRLYSQFMKSPAMASDAR